MSPLAVADMASGSGKVSAVRAGGDARGARVCPRPYCQVRRRLAGRRVEGATRVILDEIRAMGSQLAELCRKYGIAELSVFGSVARGDAQPGSDVDLLYVRVPGNDLGMSYFARRKIWRSSSAAPLISSLRKACTGSSAIRS
jgi:Nucleotidyltransferase domain